MALRRAMMRTGAAEKRRGALARMMDRTVEAVAPVHAIKRRLARQWLFSNDGYEAARVSRTRRRYTGTGGKADDHLKPSTLWQLREKCREHDRNSSLLNGLLDTACSEICGAEFQFQSLAESSAVAGAVEAAIAEAMEAERCDWRGLHDFSGMLRLTLRSLWTDGDVLHVWTEGARLQTFEAHQLATPRTVNGQQIVNGVELAGKSDNRPVAYYVTRGSAKNPNGYVSGLDQVIRVAAEDCLFVAVQTRFNQTRGVPFLASALGIYERLDGYLDSETLAAEMNAKLGLKITRLPEDSANPPGFQQQTDPLSDSDSLTTFDRLLRMEAGMIIQPYPGEDVSMIGSWRPGQQFEPYTIMVMRIVGAAVGMPLELVLLDFSKTNYSSARAALLVARRNFWAWRRLLERSFCVPWFRHQVSRLIAERKLPATDEAYRVRCTWPAWEWVDPLKEAAGYKTAIETGIKSRDEVIRERGRDPRDVDRERAEGQSREKELDIQPPPARTRPGAPPGG